MLPVQYQASMFAELNACEPYWGTPVGDRPDQQLAVLHKVPEKGVISGIWECAPGMLSLDIAADEFCHIVNGRWVITADDGESITVVSGDSFFFPKGWKGRCEIVETVRKVFTMIKG